MKYITLTFIAIALIIIGFAIKAEAQTVQVVTYKQCLKQNKGVRDVYKKEQPKGKLSNGYSLYYLNTDIPCTAAFVNKGSKVIVFDKGGLTISNLIHEAVHLAQHETKDHELQARLTTKYFFEIIDVISN